MKSFLCIALSAAVMTVVACGGEQQHDAATGTQTTSAPQTATTASVPAPAPAAAPQPDPAGAVAMVKDLYAKSAASQGPFYRENNDRAALDAYFEPALAHLLWKDVDDAKGELGALDFDPLYNAQDADIKNLDIQPASIEGAVAKVPVNFVNFDKKEQVTFELTASSGSWKIANIHYADGRTLRDVFKPAPAQ